LACCRLVACRRPHFSLLRQRKVSKRKASQRPCPYGVPCATRAARGRAQTRFAQTSARPDPRPAALLSTANGLASPKTACALSLRSPCTRLCALLAQPRKATSHKPQATSPKPQAPSSKLQAPSSKLQAPSSKLQAPSSKLQALSPKRKPKHQSPDHLLRPLRSPIQANKPAPQRHDSKPPLQNKKTKLAVQAPLHPGGGEGAGGKRGTYKCPTGKICKKSFNRLTKCLPPPKTKTKKTTHPKHRTRHPN
jgi:hypothetical protein